jgi:hypothetical protein
MFIHNGNEGPVIILDVGEVITVELPGGNGETFTISADEKSVKDEDGFDLTAAYAWGRPGNR